MLDKWLDMLGLYDFLGVICPGIFAVGMWLSLWHINFGIDDCFWELIDKYSFLKHFLYAFFVVAVYVLGSFVHELGHYCAHIYNVGFKEALRQVSCSIENNRKVLWGNGNYEAEKLFLINDFSNSNIIEREIWFRLMKQGDFCRNGREFAVNGSFKRNIKCENKYFKNKSAAFYQHCKRVISLKGFSASSKKKESIYGFCRNIGVIFGLMILFVLLHFIFWLVCFPFCVLLVQFFCFPFCVLFKWPLIGEAKFFRMIIELILLALSFVVFSAKSIRYKNMEVIDTIRTYRYLAENQKKSGKKT